MLLSKTDLKTNPLSAEQLKTIVCGGVRVDQSRSDIAVVPGCEPKIAIERAEFAYSFCQKVGGENIIVSGGVKHPYQGTLVSESELMGRYLIESGVKKEKIFSENRSRNTIENIIYSVCVLYDNFAVSEIRRVTIITSPYHLKRSLLLAGLFFPRYIEICGYTEGLDELFEKYQTDECVRIRIQNEAVFLKQLIEKGMIEDIAF